MFPKRWRVYDIFHMLLLEQDITRKEQIKETQLEFEVSNSKEYKLETIKTAQSIQKNQKVSYQDSTIWFCGKATLKKKILGNHCH